MVTEQLYQITALRGDLRQNHPTRSVDVYITVVLRSVDGGLAVSVKWWNTLKCSRVMQSTSYTLWLFPRALISRFRQKKKKLQKVMAESFNAVYGVGGGGGDVQRDWLLASTKIELLSWRNACEICEASADVHVSVVYRDQSRCWSRCWSLR